MIINSFNLVTVPSKADVLVEQGSKFIAYLKTTTTEEEVKAFLANLKTAHPDATHICYAYMLNPNNRTQKQKYSDDKEPAGTAGAPLLNILKTKNIGNACIAVVRYFGGTLLGTGGLSRAYTKADQEVIEVAKRNNALEVYNPRHLKSYFVAFSQVGQIENLCHKLEIEIVRSDFEERGMAIDILATRDLLEQFDREWASLQHKA